MAKTLILGLGNPFRGDDGIGPGVVAALRKEKFAPDVSIIDGDEDSSGHSASKPRHALHVSLQMIPSSPAA